MKQNNLRTIHRGYELIIDHGDTFTPVTLTRQFFEEFALFLTALSIRPKIKDFRYEYRLPESGYFTVTRIDRLCTLGYRQNPDDEPVTMTLDWYEVEDRIQRCGNAMGAAFNLSNGVSNEPFFANSTRPVWCGTIGRTGQVRVVFDHNNLIIARYVELLKDSLFEREAVSVLLRMVNTDGTWTSVDSIYVPTMLDAFDFNRMTMMINKDPSALHFQNIVDWYAKANKPFPEGVTTVNELKAVLMEQFPY